MYGQHNQLAAQCQAAGMIAGAGIGAGGDMAKRQAELPALISRVHMAIERVEQVGASLEQRLSPITRAMPPTPAASGGTVSTREGVATEVGHQLANAEDRLNAVFERLQAQLQLLEL